MHSLHFCFFFFFNDTATTEIYTLSLHDALPIYREAPEPRRRWDYRQGLRAGAQDRGIGAVASERRRPRGDAEQVRAVGRPAVTPAPAEAGPRRVLFVTGKLAEPALRRTLAEMAPAFAYDIAGMKIDRKSVV